MKRNVFILSAFIMMMDQVIKYFIELYLVSEISIISGFFSLLKVYNYGSAFSLFSGQTYFLLIINILIFIFLIRYMKSFKVNKRNTIAFGLVFGGLVGNLIDRVRLGFVIDYLKFDFGNYTFPIFNLADITLCIGIFLMIIAVIRKEDEVW